MNEPSNQLRSSIVETLLEVAPDIDAATLDHGAALREQFDFDSMDQLNFAVALHRKFGIDIPETDYARLASVDACVQYVSGQATTIPPRSSPAE